MWSRSIRTTLPTPTTIGATNRPHSMRCSTRSRTPPGPPSARACSARRNACWPMTQCMPFCTRASGSPWRTKTSRGCGKTCRCSRTTSRRSPGAETRPWRRSALVHPATHCHPPPPITHTLSNPCPPLPAMSDLHDLSAHALMAAYRQRQLSPVEVRQAVLPHIARWEPHLQATYLRRPEAALAQARASEARWLRGAPLSALDGVPGTIKENIATEGDPTPLGTAARMRAAGAVIVAKTTMPDYGMLSSGLSSLHPLTRNPWNLAKSPGGSSAGGGAAAAAGYGPLHIGTDIG